MQKPLSHNYYYWLPWRLSKESACSAGFHPWITKIPWRRQWLPTPGFLPGKFHGQRSLAGYSPWGHKELDMTKQYTHTHTHTLPLVPVEKLSLVLSAFRLPYPDPPLDQRSHESKGHVHCQHLSYPAPSRHRGMKYLIYIHLCHL